VSYFERLSAQDASFLVYEDIDRHAHMHIGGVSVYDGGGLTGPRGGVDAERIRRYIASRLHLVPRYRQRLARTPIFGEPVWVDDERFNVRYHVRHTRLPRPGDERELKRLVARIMSQRLDRTRPLWELWIVEGLPDGRFALVTKTHHCMIDGVSGVDISTVLMRLDDDATIAEAPPWMPRPRPGALALVGDALGRRLALVGRIAAAAPGLARTIAGGAAALARPDALRERLGGAAEMLAMAVRGPAATPFNQPIGAHRRYDWTSVALDDLRAIKRRLEGTINDAVLTVVAGALGQYLRARRVNVDILDFVTAIPVNARQEGDHALGNRVGAWLTTLPIAERDPIARFRTVRARTAALKGGGGADPTPALYGLAELGGIGSLGLVVRLMQRLSPANVIVTNVPGPPFPLFLLGARMISACPMVTLLVGQGLGIAVFSYCGRVFFGVNADWDLVPDLDRLVRAIDDAVVELRAATEASPRAEPSPAHVPPRPAAEESHGN
jgi:diacylglycerol O-acyltransferase